MSASSCLVIVPYRDHISPGCEESLRGLEDRGYTVRRRPRPASLDQKRSLLATEALTQGFEEILWIDSDTIFDPEAVERLRGHGLPLVGGIYAKRVGVGLACAFLPDVDVMTLGEGGGLVEVQYLGAGFLLTHRRVYQDVASKWDLPVCNTSWPTPVVPYFQPLVFQSPEHGWQYLSEDYSFCERARQAGHKVMVDTSIRLWHVGTHAYGWEDLAPVARVPTAKLRLKKE